MDASTSKRNGPTPSKAYKRNLRKKLVRYAKKAKLGKDTNLLIGEEINDDQEDKNLQNDKDNLRHDERVEIFYDPDKHKIQPETRKSTNEETRQYILSRWISEDFLASDLRSSNHKQSTIYTDPRFTFQEKFLEKRRQRLVVRELLKRGLLPPNNVKSGTFTLDFNALSNNYLDIISDIVQQNLYEDDNNDGKKSLAPQSTQSILTPSEVPVKFMDLLETEVFNYTSSVHHSTLKSLWKKFALWSCFATGPNFAQQFRNHCCHIWSQVNHIYRCVEAQNKPLEGHKIHETFLRNPKDKLYIADETTKEVISGINLGGYYHISDSQCFKNSFEETIVDFFDLNNGASAKAHNQTAVGNARIAVDQYYKHTIAHPSHQSKQFAKDLIEHFGGFADSNNLPYTTANIASSHCEEHQKCVQDLIKGLQPLSGSVNNYLKTAYPILYSKMEKLDLGPNVPKSFGVFPTVAVNFNIICQFHRDLKDHRNTLCVVCPLGNFEGGELTFPELKLVVHVKQGQAVAFRSNLLIHGNLPIVAGTRHSVVFYMHNTVIKQKRKFGSLFADYDLDWGDSDKDDQLPKYLPSMLGSGNNTTKLKNHRRTHIDVEGAKKGLPARYKK